MVTGQDDERVNEREAMIERVRQHFRETAAVTGEDTLDDEVAEALRRVPRHCFVPPASLGLAYADSALPIGCGQTISQPFIVALMLQLAGVARGDRVLEIGTGSGYEAAVLARLVDEAYTIEVVPELTERARGCFAELRLTNIHTRCGDGFEGWPEAAPFEAILVSACAEIVPPPLLEQLRVGGRLIIPVGEERGHQELRVLEKTSPQAHVERCVLPVAFVPLVHELEGAGAGESA